MKKDKIKVIKDILEERGISSDDINETVAALEKEQQEREKAEKEEREREDAQMRDRIEEARLNAISTILQVAVKMDEEYNRPINRLKRFFDIF